MRTVRAILTVAFSLGFLLAQMPAPAQCQMGLASSLSMRCSMPCCKKLPNPAKCPMVKKAAPRDTLASPAPQFSVSLKELALIPLLQQAPIALRTHVHAVRQTIRMLFLLKRPPCGRAPPADIVTLQA